ncbi:MAG: hypothetical protein ACRDTK_19465 [Mycobacterium sp.]
MKTKRTAITATLVVAGWAVVCGVASADPPPPPPSPAPGTGPAPGPPPAAVPAPAHPPRAAGAPAGQPKTTIDQAGTYAVGTDIVPGIYSSAGPVGHGTCYWKRLGHSGGNDIIDNAMTKKPQVVQIEAGDKAFKTDGCQPWQKTDNATPDPGQSPDQAKLQLGFLDLLNGLAGH